MHHLSFSFEAGKALERALFITCLFDTLIGQQMATLSYSGAHLQSENRRVNSAVLLNLSNISARLFIIIF